MVEGISGPFWQSPLTLCAPRVVGTTDEARLLVTVRSNFPVGNQQSTVTEAPERLPNHSFQGPPIFPPHENRSVILGLPSPLCYGRPI